MKYNFNKIEVEKLFYEKNLKIKEAAQQLNCTVIALQRYMRKENIKIAKRYTDEKKEEVFSLLDNGDLTHAQIAHKVGLTLVEVRSIIKQRQAKIRERIKFSNEVNSEFMENKPLLWYLIGLITTDGHINSQSSSVSIYQNDHSFLTNIQKLIGHTGKIYQRTNETGKIFVLTILNNDLYRFLLDSGLDFDKRHSAKFIKCPNEYLPFYIRGIFDGDGCIYYKYMSGRFEGKAVQITTGSKYMADNLKKCFTKQNWHANVFQKTSEAGNIYYDINIDLTEDVLSFCEFIYSSHLEFKLNKKYFKYIKLVKLIELDKQINEIVDTLEKSKEE